MVYFVVRSLTSCGFQLGGIKEGDFIVEVDGIDVKWYTNEQIGSMIQSSGTCLDLKVITPMDRNYLKVEHFNYLLYMKLT